MQEAAVRLLDAVTVSNLPHCCRRTQPIPMTAKADVLSLNGDIERLVAFTNRPLATLTTHPLARAQRRVPTGRTSFVDDHYEIRRQDTNSNSRRTQVGAYSL